MPSRAQQIADFLQRRQAQLGMTDNLGGSTPRSEVADQRINVQTEHTGITDRPSSRVHAPPGGASNFTFNDGSYGSALYAAPAPRSAPVSGAATFSFNDGSAPQTYTASTPRGDSPSKVAHGQRVNVQTEHTGITDRPSSRVHAPPGGASNFSFHDGSAPGMFTTSTPRDYRPSAAPCADRIRPDLDSDRIGAAMRARAQSSSIFG